MTTENSPKPEDTPRDCRVEYIVFSVLYQGIRLHCMHNLNTHCIQLRNCRGLKQQLILLDIAIPKEGSHSQLKSKATQDKAHLLRR